MYGVLGASGHVGKPLVRRLLEMGSELIAFAHSASSEDDLKTLGATTEIVDVRDIYSLKKSFSKCSTLFLLNPTGDALKDAAKIERETLENILEALSQSPVEKVVAQSSIGAQSGEYLGDLGTLFDFEKGLLISARPVRVIRAAYYYSNWTSQIKAVRKTGILQSFYPADFEIPMVSPEDLGRYNALLMTTDFDGYEITDFTGPRDYTPTEVAEAFAAALNREVKVEVVPREDWEKTFKRQGFSSITAKSYAAMTGVILDRTYEVSRDPARGLTSINEYVKSVVDSEISEGSTSSISFF